MLHRYVILIIFVTPVIHKSGTSNEECKLFSNKITLKDLMKTSIMKSFRPTVFNKLASS